MLEYKNGRSFTPNPASKRRKASKNMTKDKIQQTKKRQTKRRTSWWGKSR